MKQTKVAQEERILGTTAGGNTYIISLPKPWIEQLKLQKGDAITLVQVGSGIYFYRAREDRQSAARTQLRVEHTFSGDALARALISLYIVGFDVIEVVGSLSDEQRKAARDTAQRLIGEILQETDERLLIQTLRDPEVLSVPQLLEYIYENAEEMLKEASHALLEADPQKASRVIQRDERVDRFFLRLSRQLYAALRDPLAEVARGVSRVDFFNIHIVARQLERVADHAVKIAREAQALMEHDRKLPSELATGMAAVRDDVQRLLAQAMRAFTHLNGKEAHEALGKLNSTERLVNRLDGRVLDLKDPHLAIVVDSFSRVKDYAANIAEVALNAEALRR
jgi:phosphate uptake regulator